jgi:hypothetical protein
MPYFERPFDWNTMTGCQDCGLEYGCPEWLEAVVPNDIWAKISPTGDSDGLLCITCMARRCAALGMEDVPMMLAAGVFALEPYRPYSVVEGAWLASSAGATPDDADAGDGG